MAVLPPKLQSTESMPLLDWLNKNQALRTAGRVPFRLLETVSVHGDADNDNWLIQGDNLEALKALLPFHAGRVKQHLIFLDISSQHGNLCHTSRREQARTDSPVCQCTEIEHGSSIRSQTDNQQLT